MKRKRIDHGRAWHVFWTKRDLLAFTESVEALRGMIGDLRLLLAEKKRARRMPLTPTVSANDDGQGKAPAVG